MSDRREFSKATRLAAWNRCGGICEKCTSKLYPGKYEYHHCREDTFGGEPSLHNCLVLCVSCHSEITRKQAGVIAKTSRQRNKHIGIRRKARGRPLAGTKASGWRRKMDGTVERR